MTKASDVDADAHDAAQLAELTRWLAEIQKSLEEAKLEQRLAESKEILSNIKAEDLRAKLNEFTIAQERQLAMLDELAMTVETQSVRPRHTHDARRPVGRSERPVSVVVETQTSVGKPEYLGPAVSRWRRRRGGGPRGVVVHDDFDDPVSDFDDG